MSHSYFTGDTHFGHVNIIRFDSRPFNDITEHDEVLVANWNRVVLPSDEVWHLGDFAFRNKVHVEKYLKRLNGRINLVRGNHDDKVAWKTRHKFASAREAAYVKLDNEHIYLSHYACRVWRNSHHGSWHLYGHSHGNLPSLGLSMDVGVHAVAMMLNQGSPPKKTDYRPISLEEVRTIMTKRKENPCTSLTTG